MTSAKTVVLGLTGSIGMGKSTTLSMFAEAGADVWDADAAVHRLYAAGGAAAAPLRGVVPEAVGADGSVSRDILRQKIQQDAALLPRVEAAVHPLVAEDRAAFLATSSTKIVVCDIPLLFETGQTAAFDAVVVASAPAPVQRSRVLARPGMTEALFQHILSKQMPDAEKRALADHVIDTGKGLEAARAEVAAIMEVYS